MKSSRCFFVGLFALVIVVTGVSRARCGARDHEEGFFLRLGLGAAASAGSQIDIVNNKLNFTGTGVDLEVAIGGIVTSNLAIHGTVFGWIIGDPTVEATLGTDPPVKEKLPVNFGMSGVGAGLTYYLMPINIYLSGTVGIGRLTLEYQGLSGTSDAGLVLEALAGKEFFVSDRWGLGVAIGIIYHSISEPNIDEKWSDVSVPILFSATLN